MQRRAGYLHQHLSRSTQTLAIQLYGGRAHEQQGIPAGDYRVLQEVHNAEGSIDTLVHQVRVLGLDLTLTAAGWW